MESESSDEMERCPSCGSLIPTANLELHSLRCAKAAMSQTSPAQGVPVSSRGRFALVLCSVAVCIPLLAFSLIYMYLFIIFQYEMHRNPSQFANAPGGHVLIFNRLAGDAWRKAYLDRVPPSHLPDVWPESGFAWTHVVDDFWSHGNKRKLPLKDRSRLVQDSALTPEQAQKLKNDILAMTERLDKLQWQTVPVSRGVCGRQHNNGTLCAVHRWNGFLENRLMGRMQCWTDASLVHSDPTFVQRNPLFHPFLVHSIGFYCIIDVPGYAATLAAPQYLPLLHVNDILWYCESPYQYQLVIQKGNLPADVMRQSMQPFFFQFLHAYMDEQGENRALEDEGEVIDLDTEETDLSDEL